MGDGRYYTYLQFFKTLYFMVLVIGLSISIIYIKYKKKHFIDNILAFEVVTLILIISSFLENVVYIEVFGLALRLVKTICLTFIISLFIYYYSSKRLTKTFSAVYLSVAGFCAFVNHNIIIRSYEFSKVVYTNNYVYYYVLGAFLCVFLVVKYCLILKKRCNSMAEAFIILAYLLPIITFVLELTKIIPEQIEAYLYVLPLSIILLTYSLFNHVPVEYIPYVFNDVINQIQETVIITDIKGNIIYNNNRFEGSIPVKSIYKIDLDNINEIFLGNILNTNVLGRNVEIELINDQQRHYLIYSTTKLSEQNKTVGFLILVKDITRIKGMVNDVIEKNNRLKKINGVLANYSEVAYNIEMEKEANKLLVEITDLLGNELEKLSMMTEKAIGAIEIKKNKSDAIIDIKKVKNAAKECLDNIRKAVSIYSNHL